jgi:AGZA family xanthine/uracil permease-like MFS transporter
VVDKSTIAVGWRSLPGYGGAPRLRSSVSGSETAAGRPRNRLGDAMTDSTKPASARSFLDGYFGLQENGTDVRTEFIAGLTTFLTMVYIVFINPQILGNAGMDKGAVFVATCLAAAISTLIMALYANYPIALAPGMGLNAFFAFTLVLTYKYTWQQALAFVFLSGVLALIITVTKLREYVITAIPQNLKLAVSAGVGLFLGVIALQTSGIVVDHPVTLVTLGDLTKWPAILALFGFVLILALNHHKILGSTLIGILVVTLIGLPLQLVTYGGIVSMPPSLAPTFLQLDFSRVFEATALIVIFSLLFVDLFDTAGTLIGVAHRAGMLDAEGRLPRMGRALIADSSATVVGALVGTSNTTRYIESTAGVDAGGRTGLTGVFVALFFLLALFFSPLAGMIPAYASAAALLYVACVMTQGLAEITWDDVTEYAPAVVTAIAMPLTYSIATGIGLGFITYALAKLLAGKFAEAKPAVVILAILFAIKFAVSG